jgi:O-antigen ligase
MQYNLFALRIAQKHPLGLGTYGPEYNQLAYFYGLPLNRNFETLELVPYIVHNSFLATIVKYGWLGFVSLLAFLTGATLRYIKIYRAFSKEWAGPIVIIGAYIFIGITQDFSFAAEMQSLLVLSIALAMYGREERRILSAQQAI